MTEKEKTTYKLHTAAVINKNQLEKNVQDEHISKKAAKHYLSEYIWQLQYPNRDKTDKKVLAFIYEYREYPASKRSVGGGYVHCCCQLSWSYPLGMAGILCTEFTEEKFICLVSMKGNASLFVY